MLEVKEKKRSTARPKRETFKPRASRTCFRRNRCSEDEHAAVAGGRCPTGCPDAERKLQERPG